MKVRVLGCCGAITQGRRTTSFLVDDNLLVDAGTGVGDLNLQEMAAIDHVLLSHSHLDHIAALPLMADAVGAARTKPLMVHGLPETVDALRRHIFNNVIWPNFERIPSVEAPFIQFQTFGIGDVLEIAGKSVEILPADHTVPAVGFAVSANTAAWVFSGDTGPNPALWRRVNRLDVGALVIETAFSNDESDLAALSKHLCPTTLCAELRQIERPGSFPIWITHTKPAEAELTMAEIEGLKAAEGALHPALDVRMLVEGQLIEIRAQK